MDELTPPTPQPQNDPVPEENQQEEVPLSPLPPMINFNAGKTPQASTPVDEVVLTRPFEDLTLAEMVGQFFRRPFKTWRNFNKVTHPSQGYRKYRQQASAPVDTVQITQRQRKVSAETITADPTALWRFLVYGLALIILFVGNWLLVPPSPEDPYRLDFRPFSDFLPFFIVAAALVIGLEMVFIWRRMNPEPPAEAEEVKVQPQERVRWLTLIIGVVLAFGAYNYSTDNTFTFEGVIFWFSSVTLISLAFLPRGWRPFRVLGRMWDSWLTFFSEYRLAVLAVILITIFGTFFRFQNLDTMLPEMTSDHIEKLINAQEVTQGQYNIFYRNNGGREIFQMYAIALLSNLPGLEIDFTTMKLVATLESILTIPVMFWLGVTLMQDKRGRVTRHGVLIGVALALVTAVGYWHIAVTRVALRIILTPLVSALVIGTLVKAMRSNRRTDYILTGLFLGFGLYTYQAVRMLPVVVIVGVLLAIVFYAQTWLDRRRYVVNLLVLVLIAFVAFVPLYRFSVDYPGDFWERSVGRLFGEDYIRIETSDGETIERDATFDDRLQAFSENMSIFGDNVRNVLLMFNYRGDIIFLHNAPGYPAMNPVMAAFFLLGLLLWLIRIVRKRDAVDMLVILALFIMLMPSALALASPSENPSHTRSSGALPMAYLLTAFGVGSFFMLMRYFMQRRVWLVVVTVGLVGFLGINYTLNADRVFNAYYNKYVQAWKPLSDGGQVLRQFVESGGTYGNAFMLSYPHWWDYRIVANEAGLLPKDWMNGDIPLEQLPLRMKYAYDRTDDDAFNLDANRDLMIMYSIDQTEALAQLSEWFPMGSESIFQTYRPDVQFRIYRVPAPGDAFMQAFIDEYVDQ